jgi:DNA-binding NarL/FixJ family response regulator
VDEAGSERWPAGAARPLLAARASHQAPAELDSEQRQLLALLGQGLKLGEAAGSLQLSHRTAERRLAKARSLLGARTTAQAVMLANGARRRGRTRSAEDLNARERQVLEGVAGGLTSREIAAWVDAPTSTVDALIRSAIFKLDARTRIQAAALALTDRGKKLAGSIDEARGADS